MDDAAPLDLQATVREATPASVARRHEQAGLGATVGRYVVLGEVGRGAMGRVLRAYDPKLQREVALKEVRGVVDEEAASRLVAEARAMAKLSHPNVVAIHDVETLAAEGDGPPPLVLVMEYVAGSTLQAWLAEHDDADWRDTVARFVDAGRGLLAAHDAGVLHRDFKPANVLVAGPTVKVTDFGLAKAEPRPDGDDRPVDAEPERSGSESLTREGTVMGTPRYMAPEQHHGRPLTAAADQYAFCVALWEALSRKPAFPLRTLVESKLEGPPTGLLPGVPRHIVVALRRGLAVDANERWPSLEPLLEALDDDPSRRRKRWIAGVGVVSLVVVGSSYVVSQARPQPCSGAAEQLADVWDAERRAAVTAAFERTETGYAGVALDRTLAGLDDYAEGWIAMHTDACEATTLRGEQSAAVMDLRMACLYRAKVGLAAASDVLQDADDDVVRNAGDVVGNLPALADCADVATLQAGVPPPSKEEVDTVDAVRRLLAVTTTRREAGRYTASAATLAEARELAATIEYEPVKTELALVEGELLDEVGDYEQAEAALRRTLDLAAAHRQLPEMATAAIKLMFVLGARQQRYDAALQFRHLALGLTHGDPLREARARNSLAVVLEEAGRFAEAEAEHRVALELRTAGMPADHAHVGASRNNLGTVLYRQGKLEEAEEEHRRALAVFETTLGPDHPRAALSRANLAIVLGEQGKLEEAEAEHRRALGLRKAGLGDDHPDVAVSTANLGSVLFAREKYGEAGAMFRRALQLQEAQFGADHLVPAGTRQNLGAALLLQGKVEDAIAEYRRALQVHEAALRPAHPDLVAARTSLAEALLQAGKLGEARELAERTWAGVSEGDAGARVRARAAFVLARVLSRDDGPGDAARARDLAEEALDLYRDAVDAADVRAWLAQHPPRPAR